MDKEYIFPDVSNHKGNPEKEKKARFWNIPMDWKNIKMRI